MQEYSFEEADDSAFLPSAADLQSVSSENLWQSGQKYWTKRVDISSKARWRASSTKEGHPAANLIDNSPTTFWQSDGAQPHYLDIEFNRIVSVKQVMVFLDYPQDESYTPAEISLYAGTGLHDLVEINSYGVDRPEGWVHLRFVFPGGVTTLQCFALRLSINANHDNGRDTRVRAVKILCDKLEVDTYGIVMR